MIRFIRLAIAIAIAAPLFAGLALDALAAKPSTISPLTSAANRFLVDDRVDAHSDDDNDDDEDAPAGDDLMTYEMPTFGVAFTYDGRIWSVDDEAPAAENGGRDIVALDAEPVDAGMYIEATDQMTDAADCLDVIWDEIINLVLVDDSEVTPIDVELSETPDSASAAFIADPEDLVIDDDRAVAIVVECREFSDGDGVVAFTLISSEQEFGDAVAVFEPIRQSVTFGAESAENHSADDDENDANGEAGIFESQMFGYSLPYNAAHWTLDEHLTDSSSESARFDGPDGEALYVLTFTASSSPSEIADYWVESVANYHNVDMALYEAPDTGETIDRRNRTEAVTLYSYEVDGETRILYAHAIRSDNGRFVVLVVSESLEASYDLIKADVFPMLDQIEY